MTARAGGFRPPVLRPKGTVVIAYLTPAAGREHQAHAIKLKVLQLRHLARTPAGTKISTRSANRAHDVNPPAVAATETPVKIRSVIIGGAPSHGRRRDGERDESLGQRLPGDIDEPFMMSS